MYRSKNYKIGFVFVFLLFSSGFLMAQEEEKSDCLLKLEEAQNKFDQGRIQDIEPLIGQCLNGDEFDKAEKTQALRLLTLAYLYLEEPELADGIMLRLLENSHEFAINPAIDPSEFINLYNKFRTEPVYSVGLLFGAVYANPIITELNSTHDLNSTRQFYVPRFGFRAAFNGEYKLTDNIIANPGIGFQTISFKKTHEIATSFSGIINEDADEGFEGTETQTAIEVPLLVQYEITKFGVFTPFVSAGLSPQILISSKFPSDALSYTILGSAPVTSTTIDSTPDRNRFNLYAVAVAGLKIKLGEGFFTTQIRYSHGIFSSSKPVNSLTPDDPNLLWDLNESFDGFRLHDLGASIGYTLHIYKPKKLR